MMSNVGQLHPFTEDEIRLATSNYEAQEWLTRELYRAFQMRALTLAELAEALGLSVDETQAWLSGNVNLSMSDLRHLATALQARITYRVEHAQSRLPEWLGQLADVWREEGWATATPSVDAWKQ